MLPTLQRTYKEGLDTADERWGMSNPGVAGGTGRSAAASDMWSRLLENAGLDITQQQVAANEAATNRLYGLPSTMYNFGSGEAGLMGQQTANQLNAASGLAGLGSQYANLPMTVASQMANLGQGLTSQQIDPWTQMLSSLLGGTGQATAQTYTPNLFQQILSGLAGTLPTSLSNWDSEGWW